MRFRQVMTALLLPSALAALPREAHAACPTNPEDPHCATYQNQDYYCADPGAVAAIKAVANMPFPIVTPNLSSCQPYLPPSQRQTGRVVPSFMVVTLLYVAPGKQSQTVYGLGSTMGTQTSVSQSFKSGFQGGTTGTVSVQAGYSVTGTEGASFEIDKQEGTTLPLTSVADELDHSKDTFIIWTNPEIDGTQVSASHVEVSLASQQGQAMKLVELNVGELRGLAGRGSNAMRASLPAWKQDAIAHMRPQDFAQILWLDPYARNAKAPLDPQRFALADTLQLDGPDQPDDPIPGQGFQITNSTISRQSFQFTQSLSLSVTVKTGLDFFGIAGVGASFGVSVSSTSGQGTQTSNGSSQQATVTLKTPTVGYHEVVDVYYDALFKSFAYVCEPQLSRYAVSVDGHLVTSDGQPIVGQIVSVTLPNGVRRRVATDARGNYRIYGLPPGNHTLHVGGVARTVTVAPGAPAHVQVVVPTNARMTAPPPAPPMLRR